MSRGYLEEEEEEGFERLFPSDNDIEVPRVCALFQEENQDIAEEVFDEEPLMADESKCDFMKARVSGDDTLQQLALSSALSQLPRAQQLPNCLFEMQTLFEMRHELPLEEISGTTCDSDDSSNQNCSIKQIPMRMPSVIEGGIDTSSQSSGGLELGLEFGLESGPANPLRVAVCKDENFIRVCDTADKGVNTNILGDFRSELQLKQIKINSLQDLLDVFVAKETKLVSDCSKLNCKLEKSISNYGLLRDSKDLLATENAKMYSENNRLKREIEDIRIDYEKIEKENKLLMEEASLLNTDLKWKTESLKTNLINSDRQISIISQYEEILIKIEDMNARKKDVYDQLRLDFERNSMCLEDNLIFFQHQFTLNHTLTSIKSLKEANTLIIDELKSRLVNVLGERNYWEKKSKSLTRDLEKKLEIDPKFANSMLQNDTDLAVISSKLEQALFERNAFKDAMTKAYSDIKCEICRMAGMKDNTKDSELVADCQVTTEEMLDLYIYKTPPISSQVFTSDSASRSDNSPVVQTKPKNRNRLGKEKENSPVKTTKQLVDMFEANQTSLSSTNATKNLSPEKEFANNRKHVGCFVLGSS